MPKGIPKNGPNKGWIQKGKRISKATEFKKGVSFSPKTQFKKGCTPWNKGFKGLQKAWNKDISPSKEIREKISKTLRKYTTPLKLIIRNCMLMSEWRKKVFIRDNYTCRHCGSYGKILNVHHETPFNVLFDVYNIISFTQAIDCKQLWDVNNGLTLCKKCHKEHHRKKGYKGLGGEISGND